LSKGVSETKDRKSRKDRKRSRSNQKEAGISPLKGAVLSDSKNIVINHFEIDPEPLQYDDIDKNLNLIDLQPITLHKIKSEDQELLPVMPQVPSPEPIPEN